MAITLTAKTRLLFIGDSITDCGRREDKDEMGTGYVRRVRDWLYAKDPSTAPVVTNRGISGNKIPDLQGRWQRDVIDLAPDVLSIYIGINDVWHGLGPNRGGCPIEQFVPGYRDVLAQTRATLPSCELILCEPSVLWLTDPPNANELLRPYIAAVHELAREFGAACVVPLHDAFNRTRDARPDIPWTTDG